MIRPSGLALALAALMCSAAVARAQDVSVKIGVLNDMSGLYADIGGVGSVAAAKLAVEDFNPAAHHMKVEVVSGDHQNKADIGAAIARRWLDTEKIDMAIGSEARNGESGLSIQRDQLITRGDKQNPVVPPAVAPI